MKLKLLSKKSITVLCVILCAVLIVLTAIVCVKNSRTSSVKLSSTVSDIEETLIAKNKFAHTGIIKEKGQAQFSFNANQKDAFYQVYDKEQSAALVIRVKFTPTTDQKELLTTGSELPFNFGILYNDDFDKNGKLKEELNTKISIYADLSKKLSYRDNNPVIVDFSMAIPKSEHFGNNLPVGFFVSSNVACQILSACAAPALIGFDNSLDISFYGFSSNGGIVNFQNTSIDFSGASLAFPVQNTKSSNMPQYVITLNDDAELKGKTIKLSIGGEKLYIKNSKNVSKLEFPSASLKSPFSNAEFSENAECVKSFLLKGLPFEFNGEYQQTDSNVYKAIRTDPGLILNYNQKNWRVKEYEVFEWDRYPGILFFDTLNYDIQDDFFRRLAYYVEKRGYKGKLWSDEVLEGKHGYNAHDYSAISLADFFNKAAEENFPLNQKELLLKKILILNGLLIPDGDRVKPSEGGLVSISRESESDPTLRPKLLAHEAWHMLFFRDEDFRNFVAAVYYTFDPDSRQFLLDFFESQTGLGYDIEDEYLMHNEFMAYIMQQSIKYVPEYFVNRTNLYSVWSFTPVLSQYIRDTNAKGFEDAAIILNDYVYDVYGISGGNVALINR